MSETNLGPVGMPRGRVVESQAGAEQRHGRVLQFSVRISSILLAIFLLSLVGCQTTRTVGNGQPTPLVGSDSNEGRAPNPRFSAAEVYERIAPSVVFIETPIAVGSGVVVDGDFVLTNAHVPFPYRTVRVAFPDGTEIREAPVHSNDFIADLALIGPLDMSTPPVALSQSRAHSIGDEVFLVGYPSESDEFPVPTISRGILSRIRSWSSLGMTYYQTDASVAGGQSGGVLVSDTGEVMGISGIAFEANSFALATSAHDVAERIAGLIENLEVDGIEERPSTSTGAYREIDVVLDSYWATATFMVDQLESEPISVSAESEEDVAITILDAYGAVIATGDEMGAGATESIEAIPYTSLRYAQIDVTAEYGASVSVEGSVPMFAIDDPDDGIEISVGDTHRGHLDYPYDYDYYVIKLRRGERISVSVESIMIDAYVQIDRRGAPSTVGDDDSGRGIIGLDALLVFEATSEGDHFVLVSDSTGTETGGYRMSLRKASPEEEARTLPKALAELPSPLAPIQRDSSITATRRPE